MAVLVAIDIYLAESREPPRMLQQLFPVLLVQMQASIGTKHPQLVATFLLCWPPLAATTYIC